MTSRRWFRANREEVTTNKCTVINLIEDAEYMFRVIAENKAGMSEPGEASVRVLVQDPKGQYTPCRLYSCWVQPGR